MSPKDVKEDLNESVGMAGREPTKAERDAATKREAEEHAKDQAAAAKLPIGAPEPPAAARPVPSPAQTEAQAAAGPHRPEPATPVHHDPPYTPRPAEGNAARAAGARMRVRATQDGFYADARRRAGSVFDIASSKDFSRKWMERVPDSTPESRKTAQDRINEEHDAINAGKVSGRRATGARKVLGDDD